MVCSQSARKCPVFYNPFLTKYYLHHHHRVVSTGKWDLNRVTLPTHMYQIPGKERHCEVKGNETRILHFQAMKQIIQKNLTFFSIMLGELFYWLPLHNSSTKFLYLPHGELSHLQLCGCTMLQCVCSLVSSVTLVAKRIHDSSTFQKIYNTGAYLQVLYK